LKIDSYLAGFLLVSATTVASIAGLLIVRKVLHKENLISSHDVGGYLLSVVGTTYAVILGLIVVDAMARFEEARQTTETESNALADLILLAEQLPREKRDRIQSLALAYVERVIDDEWPVMDLGRYAPTARRAAIDLINAVSDFEPTTEKEKAIYATELSVLCEFWNCRRTRTVAAAQGIPTLEWVVLIVGGVLTMTFTYLFKLEHLKIQIIMTAMVAMILALSLFMVLMFGYPYSGEMKVSPDGFKVTRAIVGLRTGRPPSPGMR
jgi:hypothetical protein